MNPVQIYFRVVAAVIVTLFAWFGIANELMMVDLPFIFPVAVFVLGPVVSYYIIKPIFIKKQKQEKK